MTEETKRVPKMEERTHIPRLDTRKCVVCVLCQYLCPDLAITRNEKSETIIEIDYKICRGCGICVFICPKQAIEMIVEE